ncbi:hypothetical protein [Streptomyces halobius]|uniref:Uncharacterized protein n=1 Tax=Streptomyces halobius TaxID=2879846 RepID=A0ABY4M2M3_9ACTN|nr:hypothetical protein [Streptomyces halobius]UQA90595.1 hypothetical protein K9S39_00595 [Streptomyces halobius]
MYHAPVGLLFPRQGTQRQGTGEPWRDTPSPELAPRLPEAVGEDLADLLPQTPTEQLEHAGPAQRLIVTVALATHAEAVRRTAPDTERAPADSPAAPDVVPGGRR